MQMEKLKVREIPCLKSHEHLGHMALSPDALVRGLETRELCAMDTETIQALVTAD